MPEETKSNLAKAAIVVGGEEIPVKFNPTEYNIDKSISYADQSLPGFTSPVTQFTSGEAETLSMELFFDAYEEDERDVRTYTDRVRGLLEVDGDLHAPPICRFVWGGLDFKSVLQSANTRFTMFLPTGVPVRARMDVTFKEYRPPGEQAEQVRRSSADKTKLRRVREEETLWLLAEAEYGDPTRWRPIADANDVDNPRRLRPGDRLVIPRVEP